jgi:hypothetical protein
MNMADVYTRLQGTQKLSKPNHTNAGASIAGVLRNSFCAK